MTDFERLLAVLVAAKVEFIIVGGFAATAHGSAHVTSTLMSFTGELPKTSPGSPPDWSRFGPIFAEPRQVCLSISMCKPSGAD